MQLERQGDGRYSDGVRQLEEIDMYTVNKQTKEHRLYDYGDECSEYQDIIQADADGWIEHSGRECPLPDDQLCEVKLGNSRKIAQSTSMPASWLSWNWERQGLGGDIIAYRPILESQPTEWRGPQDGLPPVGWRGDHSPSWHACEVVAYHKGFAVVWDAHDLEYFRTKDPSIFRPIRTDREKWVENAHDAAGYGDNNLFRKVAGKIYDALKSGDLPQP